MYKYKIKILLVFTLLISLTSRVYASKLPLIGKIIYIDPGHGGIDPGTVYKEYKESTINLEYSFNIGSKLEESGATVLYTRIDNYDLATRKYHRKKSDLLNRVKLINESNADIYLSIHVNSENTKKWYGAQIFYTINNKNNIRLAKAIQKELNRKSLIFRKPKEIEGLYMYDNIEKTGILYEIGFLSNYSDRKRMSEKGYTEEISNAIVSGIIRYFN